MSVPIMITTTPDRSERQLEIIESAGKIMTNSGISGLTIKNLAREMKFSEAAIYRHFTSKEHIVVAMLHYLAESLEELYVALPSDEEPEARLRALLRQQFRFFKKHPDFVVAVFSDGLMEESKRINESIKSIMGVMIRYLTPVIKEGQSKGIFTPAVSTDDLIHIIMGAIRLHMFKWRICNFQSDVRKSGERLIDSILTLIKTK